MQEVNMLEENMTGLLGPGMQVLEVRKEVELELGLGLELMFLYWGWKMWFILQKRFRERKERARKGIELPWTLPIAEKTE